MQYPLIDIVVQLIGSYAQFLSDRYNHIELLFPGVHAVYCFDIASYFKVNRDFSRGLLSSLYIKDTLVCECLRYLI